MDRDLVEQARRGDREAFAVLVHQVSDSLYAVAQRILRDSGLAEDALQNALVLAWRRIPHLREPIASRRGSIASSSTPATTNRSGRANGRPTSGSCPSMGRRPRTAVPSSPTATNWSGPSAGSRSTSGRSSSCTTTSGCRSWRSPRCSRSPRARPDRDCTTRLARSARPSRPNRSRPSPEDVSHDRRSLARTRRSLVARGRTDPGARPRRGGRPPPDRNDFTGTGSSDPVEVAQDDHSCPRCCGRRDRRARDRRRLLPALAGRSIQCRRSRPIAQRSALGERGALGVGRARACRCARDHPWRLASDVRWRHHRSVRRQRAHPALRRLAGWPPHVDPDDRRRSGPQVGDLAGTSR